MRQIEGLALEHLPGYGTAPFCHICGRLYGRDGRSGIRCHAVPERKPRQRKRGRPGVVICGLCWEDAPARRIQEAVQHASGNSSESP